MMAAEADAAREPELEGAEAEAADDDKIEEILETTQAQDFCLESITPCVPY